QPYALPIKLHPLDLQSSPSSLHCSRSRRIPTALLARSKLKPVPKPWRGRQRRLTSRSTRTPRRRRLTWFVRPRAGPHTSGELMFDHVKFGVSDYAASKAFFLKALEPLGVAVVSEGPPTYGVELSPKGKASLCLYQTEEKP